MSDKILAANKLIEGQFSCVLVKDGDVIMTSKDRGIRPIIKMLMADQHSLKDMVLADKIIGKAAALLVVFGQIEYLYAHVISDCAKNILEKNNIEVNYNHIVPYIMNGDGTDKCMMEKMVEDIEDPFEAFTIFKDFFNDKL